MKTINYIILALFIVALSSCEKMDSSYEDFIIAGGIDYPGKVILPKAYPGKNRVKLAWVPNPDPSIAKTMVFWNNFQDTLEVNVDRTQDTVKVFVNDLPEKSTYSFVIKNYNSKGIESIPEEVITSVYGETYQASIRNRPLIESLILGSSKEVITRWDEGNTTNGAYAVDLKYIDNLDNEIIETFLIDEESFSIQDMKGGTTFEYRTVYLPEASLDTFYTDFVKNEVYYLAKEDWTVTDFSTNHPGGDNQVQNVIDGTSTTRWHTYAGASSYPHYVTVDMGAENTLSNFEVFRMKGDDRGPDVFNLWASSDNVTWVDLGEFNFDRFTDQAQLFEIDMPAKARYFKFEGISGPEAYMVLGEISLKYFDVIPE